MSQSPLIVLPVGDTPPHRTPPLLFLPLSSHCCARSWPLCPGLEPLFGTGLSAPLLPPRGLLACLVPVVPRVCSPGPQPRVLTTVLTDLQSPTYLHDFMSAPQRPRHSTLAPPWRCRVSSCLRAFALPRLLLPPPWLDCLHCPVLPYRKVTLSGVVSADTCSFSRKPCLHSS